MKNIRKALMVELYRLMNSDKEPEKDFVASVKLPCGSELIVKIKTKKRLELVKASRGGVNFG